MSADLLRLLREETAAIEAFLAVLAQEEGSLLAGQFDELPALTGRKSELLTQIAALDQQRESMQQAQGLPSGRAGADAAAAAGGEAVQQAWQALLERAEQASLHNRRNGTTVYTHLDFTQQALGVLKASGQPFYGPDGSRRAGTGAGNRLAQG